MKKILVSVLVALACCVAANAQVWLNGGYLHHFEKETIGSVSYTQNYGGFFIGAEYEFELSDAFSVAPGLQLQGVFGKYDNENVSELGFKVPVMLRLGVDLSDSVRGYLHAGPEFYLGLSAKSVSRVIGQAVVVDLYKNDYSRFDMDLAVGLGVEIANRFRIFGRYGFGVIDTCKDKNCKCITNSLTVGVGFQF